MKKSLLLTIVAFTSAIMILISCKKENNDVTNISHNGETQSHNMGQNCFNCHKKDGSGKGIFTIAGTIYNNAGTSISPNGKVELFTQPNGAGDLVRTVQADANGNFFTTEVTNITMGVYAVVTSAAGVKQYMPESNASGQCNNCHNGIGTPRIWVP